MNLDVSDDATAGRPSSTSEWNSLVKNPRAMPVQLPPSLNVSKLEDAADDEFLDTAVKSPTVLWHAGEEPLKSALRKAPSPPTSPKGSPTKVRFSPTLTRRKFFGADPPEDVSRSVLKRYSLRLHLPVIQDNLPVCVHGVQVSNAHKPVIEGLIRVKNIALEKRVTVKFTTTDWTTFSEVEASWLPPSASVFGAIIPRGDVEFFKFEIDFGLGHGLQDNMTRIAFCVKYEVAGSVFWDNAHGRNYDMELLASLVETELTKLDESTEWADIESTASTLGSNRGEARDLDT